MPRKRSGVEREYTHGSWRAMRDRCKYSYMGKYHKDKGVTVCKEWETYSKFKEDMGERPHGHVLDRIDNTKGYSKDNCRWVNPTVSSYNRRLNKYGRGISYNKTRKKFYCSIRVESVYYFIGYFESIEQAINERKKVLLEWYGEGAIEWI